MDRRGEGEGRKREKRKERTCERKMERESGINGKGERWMEGTRKRGKRESMWKRV